MRGIKPDIAVYQYIFGGNLQAAYRLHHSQTSGLIDVDRVYGLLVHYAYAVDGFFNYLAIGLFTAPRGKFFRIVDPRLKIETRQYTGAGHYRPGKGPPAGL